MFDLSNIPFSSYKKVGLMNQAPTNNSNPFNQRGFDESSPYNPFLISFYMFSTIDYLMHAAIV